MPLSLKKTCSRLGLALFAFLSLWYLASIFFSSLLFWIAPQWQLNGWGLFFLNDLSLYGAGMPAFLLLSSLLPNHTLAKGRAKPLNFLQYLFVLLVCFGIMYGVGILTEFFFLSMERIFGFVYTNSLEEMVSLADWPALLLFGVLVPAVGEEFLFRRVLHRKLAAFGDKIYIFLSALCFGLFHINPSQILYAFLLGLILAGVYVRCKRLSVCISLHFLLNFLGLLVVPALMEHSAWLANLLSFILVLLFPFSFIVLIWFFRKMPTFAAKPQIPLSAKPPLAAQCLVNVGMLLYLGLVLLLLIFSLWVI